MCIQVQDSTSSADLPSLEAVVQIKGSGRSSSAVFQAAAYGLAHCSWLSASLFSACSNFRRSPPFLHQRLGIVVEASEGPSARTSLAFKLLLSRGVMGKYVGRRNSPLSVAWISTSHSGFPSSSTKAQSPPRHPSDLLGMSDASCWRFPTLRWASYIFSRCSCDSFSSWETFKLCK